MRNLVVLRGAPGAGKSTWIKNNNLENYTLCADTIRMMFSSPVLNEENTHRVISQNNESQVWALLFELLEKRMEMGEFVILDATHSRSSDFSRYKNLAQKYRYRTYYVDFSDVDIDVCKAQNKMRENYKFVPEEVIDKIYARLKTQCKTSGYREVNKDTFKEEFANKTYNFDKWDKIHIFGDIHGCFEPLKEYISQNEADIIIDYNDPKQLKYCLNPNEFYLFTGDYVDRGLQNKEVLEFLISIKDEPNVLMLEGNHERWLWYYANDEINNVHSKEFKINTIPQIASVDKSKIRQLYRRLGQMAYFNYNGNTYLVSHGGLPYIPDDLQFVSTEQLIKGVGRYATDIDNIFDRYYQETNIYQVHGHRNTYESTIDEYKHSMNLEGKIEFGGNLRVFTLVKDGDYECHNIKNNTYYIEKPVLNDKVIEHFENDDNIVNRLKKSRSIRETELGNSISSFNFTRDVFHKGAWDKDTTRCRGLFMNTDTGKVVARGYDKFFNINEVRDTELQHLRGKIDNDSAICYKKYNGYLGLLSYYNDELHFHSKSTDKGDFALWFKDIFEQQYTSEQKSLINTYLKDNDVTFIYEVIDPINDPHIIKNNDKEIVLLDIVDNNLVFNKMIYSDLVKLCKEFNIKCKERVNTFTSYRQFMEYYLEHTNELNFDDEDIEGVVIEIGNFMTKLKFNYYKFWKQMRGLKDTVAHKRTVQLSHLYNDIANYFYSYLKGLSDEDINKDIIFLRNDFYSKLEEIKGE